MIRCYFLIVSCEIFPGLEAMRQIWARKWCTMLLHHPKMTGRMAADTELHRQAFELL